MTAIDGAPYGLTETGAQYAEATRHAVDVAWVEQLVADSAKLQATKFELYTLDGRLWVQVRGGRWEAHAWQVATMGRIFSSYVDSHGVWRQLIIGERVHVEVIDDPRKREGAGQ